MKRDVHIRTNVRASKETYICEKRHTYEGKCACQKRPKSMKRDVHIRTDVRASKVT